MKARSAAEVEAVEAVAEVEVIQSVLFRLLSIKMAPVSKAKAKAKAVAKAVLPTNLYDMLEGKTGNPTTPAEFDESYPEEGELFFKAAEDADEADKKKVDLLNYIHQELHHDAEHKVPALDAKSDGRPPQLHPLGTTPRY